MRRGYQISQVETAHRKRTAVSSLLIFIAIPAVIILGFTLFNDRIYPGQLDDFGYDCCTVFYGI